MQRGKVVTYRGAYLDKTVSLCARHRKTPPFLIGAVEHGAHHGTCAMCVEHDYEYRCEACGDLVSPDVRAGEVMYCRAHPRDTIFSVRKS